LQRVELTSDGCNYLSVHSKLHFMILMASNNGSIFFWTPKPTKIIQNLAPGFHELERNIQYVENEEEFEDVLEFDGDDARLMVWEKEHAHEGIDPLDKR